MTRQSPAPIDRFIEAADEMRTLLPEMRAAIKDARALVKELHHATEEARDAVPSAGRELVEAEVAVQLTKLKEATEAAVAKTMDTVLQKLSTVQYAVGLVGSQNRLGLPALAIGRLLAENPECAAEVRRMIGSR